LSILQKQNFLQYYLKSQINQKLFLGYIVVYLSFEIGITKNGGSL